MAGVVCLVQMPFRGIALTILSTPHRIRSKSSTTFERTPTSATGPSRQTSHIQFQAIAFADLITAGSATLVVCGRGVRCLMSSGPVA